MLSQKIWVEIDAAALRHNLHIFQKLAGSKTSVMAVVKANAYGHGLPEVAKILATSGKLKTQNSKLWFGVDSVDEALTIRGFGIKNPILILGYIPPERLEEVIANDISFSVYSKELLEMIAKKKWTHLDSARRAARQAKKPRMHIKIETGTNRLGMRLEELSGLGRIMRQCAGYVEGVYTHFADTENPQSSFWKEQIARFDEAIAFLKKTGANPIRHAASSAGALLYPETRYDMIRAGIGLYGLWPSSVVKHSVFNNIMLRPVLTWKTKIAQIKKIKKGETIGYDRAFKAPCDMAIAILPIGYWDGYDRRLSDNGAVLIQGERAPIAGRVCMNMVMADITKIKNIREQDEVVLLGKQKREELSAEELAKKIGTINYEVITRINPFIPKRIMNHES